MQMSVAFHLLCCLLLQSPGQITEGPTAEQPDAEKIEFFEREVRPLLAEHCFECHSSKSAKLQAGLLLDSRQGFMTGGDSGPAIVLDKIEDSPFLQAVRYEGFEMPPKGKLSDKQIAALERWVRMGAPWPAEEVEASAPTKVAFDLNQRKANHWVWQPIVDHPLPTVVQSTWPTSNIDYFVLSELEAAKLKPAKQVDRNALVRRLYLDLIGLPPTPEQVSEFVADDSPDATSRLVDRLLESPRFGERWGRHWLDLMRFAESRGHEFDNDAPFAYQFRDYIIRALNADVPYDQLVREHLAGDLIESPRLNPNDGFNESILGRDSGILVNGSIHPWTFAKMNQTDLIT